MLNDCIELSFFVDAENFVSAGTASEEVKNTLKKLGVPSGIIRKVAISMYEGEINMVIHANGGTATAKIYPEKIVIVLADKGPGIADIELAFKEGYSTATETVRELGFGAGMGLPNMRKYSDKITVESEVGVGTTVSLEIYL